MTALSWGAVMLVFPGTLLLGGCDGRAPQPPDSTTFIASRQTRFGAGRSPFCDALREAGEEATARRIEQQGRTPVVHSEGEIRAALRAYQIATSAGNSLLLAQPPTANGGTADMEELEFVVLDRLDDVTPLLRAVETAIERSTSGAPTRAELLSLAVRIRDDNAIWLSRPKLAVSRVALDTWIEQTAAALGTPIAEPKTPGS